MDGAGCGRGDKNVTELFIRVSQITLLAIVPVLCLFTAAQADARDPLAAQVSLPEGRGATMNMAAGDVMTAARERGEGRHEPAEKS